MKSTVVATKSSVRRMARRGGVKRIAMSVYDEARSVMHSFVRGLVRDALAYTEFGKRTTVSAMDVIHALKKRGKQLYGYDSVIVAKKKPSKVTAKKVIYI